MLQFFNPIQQHKSPWVQVNYVQKTAPLFAGEYLKNPVPVTAEDSQMQLHNKLYCQKINHHIDLSLACLRHSLESS